MVTACRSAGRLLVAPVEGTAPLAAIPLAAAVTAIAILSRDCFRPARHAA
jgi:hypothetical protein